VAVTTAISWGMGFNHDARVSVDAIQIPEVHESIAKFNATVAGIEELGKERTALNGQLDAAKQAEDVVGVLDAEHDLSVINIRISRLKHEAHLLRAAVRSTLMDGVEVAGGAMVFYRQGEAPSGAPIDGRTWRIKIGNSRLDTADLKMIGGGAIVGTVPSGIPAISAPTLDFKVMLHLIPFAAIISLLGFMEAISIAKAMAAKTGQRLDPNQELIGQGLANMLGACGKSYPASGSFSRSAVNLQAGAVTGMSSVFTSLMVVIVLLFFTPLLYHLPQAVLAAVIMMAVIGLINASGFVHAWKAQWYDGAISILSFIATLAFAPHLDKGIMIGVALSLLVFLYKSMRPKVASLSRTDDESLRDATIFGLKECRHIALVRFDGPLFFANASFLEDQITDRMMENDKLRHIIIVANGINDMDASGEEALSLIVDRVRSSGMDISLCGVNEAVMAVLERTHLLEKIGKDHVFPTMETAICATRESAHANGEEESCPLTTVCRIA
jgi:sulfate permease, SulP family